MAKKCAEVEKCVENGKCKCIACVVRCHTCYLYGCIKYKAEIQEDETK